MPHVTPHSDARHEAFREGYNLAMKDAITMGMSTPEAAERATRRDFPDQAGVPLNGVRNGPATIGEMGLCGNTTLGEDAPETVLAEAERIINGPRAAYYGEATTNHARIARLWDAFLASRPHPLDPLEPHEVALLMVLMKMARLIESSGHRDSYVDMCGYAALAFKMADRHPVHL